MVPKWTGSEPEVDWKWSGSGPEVDWKCPSVRPYVCPSQTYPLPPWWTLCEGSTIFQSYPHFFAWNKALHNPTTSYLHCKLATIRYYLLIADMPQFLKIIWSLQLRSEEDAQDLLQVSLLMQKFSPQTLKSGEKTGQHGTFQKFHRFSLCSIADYSH